MIISPLEMLSHLLFSAWFLLCFFTSQELLEFFIKLPTLHRASSHRPAQAVSHTSISQLLRTKHHAQPQAGHEGHGDKHSQTQLWTGQHRPEGRQSRKQVQGKRLEEF